MRFAKKAIVQISHHVKDGITEDYIRRRVLFSLEDDRRYFPDRSFMLSYRMKRGTASPIMIRIYVRVRTHNKLIQELLVYGVHVRKA